MRTIMSKTIRAATSAHWKLPSLPSRSRANSALVAQAAGGVGGSAFFSRCGARSTWLALCQARSLSGTRSYLLCMMASSCVTSSLSSLSSVPIRVVAPVPACVSSWLRLVASVGDVQQVQAEGVHEGFLADAGRGLLGLGVVHAARAS